MSEYFVDYFDAYGSDDFGGKAKARRDARHENKAKKSDKKHAQKMEKKALKFTHKQTKQTNRLSGRETRALNRQDTRLRNTETKENAQTEREQIKAVSGVENQQIEGATMAEKSGAGVNSAQSYNEGYSKIAPMVNSQPSAQVDEAVYNVIQRDGLQPKFDNYLQSRGLAPDEIADGDIYQAAQIANQYDNDVTEIAVQMGVPYQDAEELYWSQNEMQSFDPVTMAFINAAGQKAIMEIGKAQAKKGKTFMGKMYDPNTGMVISAAPGTGTAEAKNPVRRIVDSGVAGVEKQKTNEAITDALPYIIIAAVGLIVVGFIIKK